MKPTLDEVKEYFAEKGYTEESAEKAYRYYEIIREEQDLDHWVDNRGKQIKNWKLKMSNVWFKPDHKIVEKPEITKTTREKMFGELSEFGKQMKKEQYEKETAWERHLKSYDD